MCLLPVAGHRSQVHWSPVFGPPSPATHFVGPVVANRRSEPLGPVLRNVTDPRRGVPHAEGYPPEFIGLLSVLHLDSALLLMKRVLMACVFIIISSIIFERESTRGWYQLPWERGCTQKAPEILWFVCQEHSFIIIHGLQATARSTSYWRVGELVG